MPGRFRCTEFAIQWSQRTGAPRLGLIPHAPTLEDAAAKETTSSTELVFVVFGGATVAVKAEPTAPAARTKPQRAFTLKCLADDRSLCSRAGARFCTRPRHSASVALPLPIGSEAARACATKHPCRFQVVFDPLRFLSCLEVLWGQRAILTGLDPAKKALDHGSNDRRVRPRRHCQARRGVSGAALLATRARGRGGRAPAGLRPARCSRVQPRAPRGSASAPCGSVRRGRCPRGRGRVDLGS